MWKTCAYPAELLIGCQAAGSSSGREVGKQLAVIIQIWYVGILASLSFNMVVDSNRECQKEHCRWISKPVTDMVVKSSMDGWREAWKEC